MTIERIPKPTVSDFPEVYKRTAEGRARENARSNAWHKANPESGKRYIRSDKGKEVVRRKVNKARSLDAEFIAWDGEGVTDGADNRHRYVLFGSSHGDYLLGRDLGTRQCLELLLSTAQAHPGSIHTIFAGTYDVNMMLKDVDLKRLAKLYTSNRCYWEGYSIEYIPRKWITIRHGSKAAGDRVRSITLYDVFTYFSTSFVKALREYGVGTPAEVDRIMEGKGARSEFTDDDLERLVVPYWQTELSLLVQLCDSLRTRLHSAGIYTTRWHGPGAVASAVLKQYGIKHHMTSTIEDLTIQRAVQSAYAGGRFQQFRVGEHHGNVYQYDIRSAYPSFIRNLPSLRGTRFVQSKAPKQADRIHDFSLCHVRYDRADHLSPGPAPFHHRRSDGTVAFPPYTEGWYWGVEVKAAMQWEPEAVDIIDYYELQNVTDYPFRWVEGMYLKRAQWKREGNPAQLALKLALNSLYGKMVQQVGWRFDKEGSLKLPPYHQLEWGGYVTAATRALLYHVMRRAGDDLIACETDAVFTRRPLSLDVGPDLGQWEPNVYQGIIYLQSGVYFVRSDDDWQAKYRGFDDGSIKLDAVRGYWSRCNTALRDGDPVNGVEGIVGSTTRFVTMGRGLQSPDVWRTWLTEPRKIQPLQVGNSKSMHISGLCKECIDKVPFDEGMHTMVPYMNQDLDGSKSYPLEWVDGGERLMAHDYAMEDEAWLVDESFNPLSLTVGTTRPSPREP